MDPILEYTNALNAPRFDASRPAQDAVIRNLQTLAESSQRLSSEVKGTEPLIPWRELAGFRNATSPHGYLGVDLGAVWLVVEQDSAGAYRCCQPHGHAPRPSRLIRTAAWPLNDRRLLAASEISARHFGGRLGTECGLGPRRHFLIVWTQNLMKLTPAGT